MPRVAHFEINADDPERVANFYKSIFGWEIKKWDGPIDYWMVMTGDKEEPGIDGGISMRSDAIGAREANSFVNTIEVNDIDKFLTIITESGGSVYTPKMPIPTVGWIAYCKDTEGNLFGIMQNDKTAQ